VQLDPAVSVDPHPFELVVKSDELVPVTAGAVQVMASLAPVFVMVRGNAPLDFPFGMLPKFRAVGLNANVVAVYPNDVSPLAVVETVPPKEQARFSVAVLVPVVVGVEVTTTVQEAPAARAFPAQLSLDIAY
jgi:hypothetical protein